MSNLHTLVYLSNASQLFTDNELNEILAVSRKNNSARNISGILIYCEGNILQVLEGAKDEIHTLYKKIETDLRHKDLIILQDIPLTERNFEDWSMGYKSATPEEFEKLEGFFDLKKGSGVNVGDANTLKSLINDFVSNNS
jgi:hypothetical protein